MIRLHYANRLENLIAPLAAAILRQQRAQPLERVSIIVPNRAIEHFLQHRISEAIGIAANLEFPFLRRFLARVVEAGDPKLRILDVEELELVLFESLRVALRSNSQFVRTPRDYVEAGNGAEADRELRTFHLARQMAQLFREYSLTRRSMLHQWMKRGDTDLDELSGTEKWQRHLWKSTFDPNGYLRAELKSSLEHNWMLLPDAFEIASQAKLKEALPANVHVFGLAYTGPAYARIFAQIGTLADLHIYALNPCLEFWEDVEHLSRVDRASWVRRHQKVGDDLERDPDPFHLNMEGDAPALRLWARPGREYIRILNELTECDFEAHFSHQDSSNPAYLLGALQENILTREPERVPGADTKYLTDDGSIRFLACPGIAREAEIVANEVWSMLEDDMRGADAIRFHQIGVIVPDAMYRDYLPHIESAFARVHHLPMNVVSRGSRTESPVREAIELLLQLPLGRFSRDEMLHLLNHPAIRPRDLEWEIDQVNRWCQELGIFFGADADDLADTYLPRDLYHWDQGIRRLALGVFMGAEGDQEPRLYCSPESIEYLPQETSEEEMSTVAAFIKTAQGLLSDAMEIRSRRLTLAQWSRLIEDLILTHVHIDDPGDERIRERCFEALESVATPELESAPVSYRVAYELISDRLAAVESRLVQFNEHGIVVGPLSALRSIPFRAIFLLAMNEDQFPERDRHDPMDLRVTRRKAGDVTSTERDRYLFLETLLAARERLCLSYIARDAKTGDQLEPSSVVRELQFILRGYVDSQRHSQLTIEHPLSRYDSRYFSDTQSIESAPTRALRSYDSDAHHGAKMAALRRDLERHCGHLSLPGRDEPVYRQLAPAALEAMRPALGIFDLPRSRGAEGELDGEISLPISALRKFLECPLQGAAQYALGIFEDEAENVEESQDEPIVQSMLDRTMLLRQVFWKIRGDLKLLPLEYSKTFRIAQMSGDAPAGPFAEAANHDDQETVERWIEQAREAGYGSLDQWREIRIGRGNEFAKADRVIAELLLPVCDESRGKAARSRIVRIHGSVGFVSPGGDASLRPVLRAKAKVKDFLGAFISAIVLAAAGEVNEKDFHAIVVGAKNDDAWNDIRSVRCPTREEARTYLSELVSDLLFGKNHYFLPIEAVVEVNRNLAKGQDADLIDVIDDTRENEFGTCSSDFGPIRDARRFKPPTAEELSRIMTRRFGLLRAVFGPDKD